MTTTLGGSSRDIVGEMVDFAENLAWSEVPSKVQHNISVLVADSLLSGVAGSSSEASVTVERGCRKIGGSTKDTGATAWFSGDKYSADLAALINGTSVRACDWNDVYVSSNGVVHPSDNVAPLLAVAEQVGASYEELLLACLASYEVHCRLADGGLASLNFDNLAYGSVAAAVGACRLLNSSSFQMGEAVNAAAVSGVSLGATRRGDLSLWKGIGSGYAARHGINCAFLAAEGVTSPKGALDGPFGLFEAVGSDTGAIDFTTIDEWKTSTVTLKRYPVQYSLQPVLEACLALRKCRAPEEGDLLKVGTFQRAAIAIGQEAEKWWPRNRETADHSMPYCAYYAYHQGATGQDLFSDSRIALLEKETLTRSVKIEVDAEVNRNYPKQLGTKVTVTNASGDVLGEYAAVYEVLAESVSADANGSFFHDKVHSIASDEDGVRSLLKLMERLMRPEGSAFDVVQLMVEACQINDA